MKYVMYSNLGKAGRLGNCMFQAAAALGLSDAIGAKAWCPFNAVGMNEYFSLHSFLDPHEPPKIRPQSLISIAESRFEHDQDVVDVMDKAPNAYSFDLFGYFQSPKYWPYPEKIQSNFDFLSDIKLEAQKLLPADPETSISMHVRRGDYTKISGVHPLLGFDYYESALQTLHSPNKTILVFSDDIQWCKDNMPRLGFDMRFIEHDSVQLDPTRPSDHGAYVEMCAMSMCSEHIIANSSYSWWAAFLSGNHTIAPSKWFGPAGPPSWRTIYCDMWTIL